MTSNADFAQIRAFVAVGEALSFSRAAEALGVSPSALSQMVRGLEERTGVRLFNRTTRSVSLTAAGQALFLQVQPAVASLGLAVAQTRKAGKGPAGIVRVHSFFRAGDVYLAPMLAAFKQDFPDVVLDITLDDAVADIVEEGYDVAIRIGEVIERDMVAVRLGRDFRQVVVASPEYLAQHGRPKTPHELHNHSCIRWRWPGHKMPYNWEFWQKNHWFAVAVDGPLIVNNKELALKAAVSGIGLAFAVEESVAPLIAVGKLVPLLRDWSAPFPGYFLCYPRQRQMAPALRAFIDAVRASAARHEKATK
ncbi:MAG: LysR family transcriptional regulator [Micavibrio sp.]|nr:LysR family transcriptional regulator [Micavibrio sp.]